MEKGKNGAGQAVLRDDEAADGKRATRNTMQRALVLEAARALKTHPTSADIYDLVRQRHPSISRATVYRNLNVLSQKGDLLRVEVPNGADRFDFLNEPHYHARCSQCGKVVDVAMPFMDDLARSADAPRGFLIESHQIMFEGLCADCASG